MKWSSNFTYAIGLFTADGCLSIDGRHLIFTSKDKEQVVNFKKCLNLKNKIGKKSRSTEKIKKYFCIQFGDVKLYKFLQSIGLSPHKSLTIKYVKIPDRFFADFLRGLFDGDGSCWSFYHPESRHLQIRFKITSASPKFLKWLQKEISYRLKIRGYITKNTRAENLEYATGDTLKILRFIYYSPNIISLLRKLKKTKSFMLRT